MIFSTAQHNSVSMFSFHKLVPLKHIIFSVPRHTDHKIGKIGAKTTFHVQKIHLLHTFLIIQLLI